MLLLYNLWDHWPIFMILGSSEQLQQEFEYNLLKPACHSCWISKMQSGREETLKEWYAIKLCFKLGKMPQKRMECFPLILEYLAWIENQFLSGIRDSRKVGSLWGMIKGYRGVRKSIHQSWYAKGLWLGLGLLCWGFKGVQEEIRRNWPALFNSGQWHFQQNNASVYNSTLSQTVWPRWASTQFLTVPIVQTLLPITFGYSLSSEAVVMRQLRRWKRLWRRSLTRSPKKTSMEPYRSCVNGTSALQPEEITCEETRVSRVYYQ